MVIFGLKRWLHPFVKMAIFDFFNFLFSLPRKAWFRSRISSKTFSLPILPEQKKLEKWPFLDQKHGLTPLEKCQFFDFKTSCFYSLESRFFVLEYRERHFPGLYCQKKKMQKSQFFEQNHGSTPLQKCQFFDFLNLLFLYPRKAFFLSRIS